MLPTSLPTRPRLPVPQTLSRTEIEAALSTWNVPIDKEEVDELLAACDKNGTGEITYDDFVAHLTGKFAK